MGVHFCKEDSSYDESSAFGSFINLASMKGDELKEVELFIEFSASIQPVDILEIGRTRGCNLPSIAEINHKLRSPGYREFVSEILAGDVHSLETMASKFVEYQVSQDVFYTEVLVDPYDFVTDEFDPHSVIHTLLRGFSNGREKHLNLINILIDLQDPENALELLSIAEGARDQGVVGFNVPAQARFLDAIQEIKEAKFGITMATSTAKEIRFALNNRIPRIRNAFQCILDDNLYKRVIDSGVFMECCLSLAARDGDEYETSSHPVLKFKDDLRFGFFSGKPFLCETTYQRERENIKERFHGWFNQVFLDSTNLWALENSFQPEPRKAILEKRLRRVLHLHGTKPSKQGISKRSFPLSNCVLDQAGGTVDQSSFLIGSKDSY